MLHIPEVFCHGQAGKAHPHTGSGGFVHLTVDHGGLFDNAGLGHFPEQVVAFPGPLANAGEHGIAVMGGGDVVDQLLNEHGLAHACAAEQTDLAALGVGADQVDDLDAGFQNFGSGLLLIISGGGAMDGPTLLGVQLFAAVDGLAQQIEHPAQALLTHRHADGCAGVGGFGPTLEAVGGAHGDAADHIVANVLGDFGHDGAAVMGNFDGAEQLGKIPVRKSNVQDRADDLRHGPFVIGHWIQLLFFEVQVRNLRRFP